MDEFAPLSHALLEPATSYQRPPAPPSEVTLDDPAESVMTDFSRVSPVTIEAGVSIDEALEHMKESGVRLLLVVAEVDDVAGLISSYDIQGEKPVKLAEENRVARSDLLVAQVMTPLGDVKVLRMLSVRNARVGHVVSTFRHLELSHLVVTEGGHLEAAATGLPETPTRVRGLFSAAQVSRQLGMPIEEVMTAAHSLAEMNRERS